MSERRESWHEQLRVLYGELEREIDPHQHLCRLRGVCCDFRVADHRLYTTEIEARYLIRARREAGLTLESSDDEKLCPFWKNGLCEAREHRPLGCRTYFCAPDWKIQGEEIHARYLRRLVRIGEEQGIPYHYEPWVDQLHRLEFDRPPKA